MKGFKGYITGNGPDGTVDAKLTIFGRETAARAYTRPLFGST
jgi:hypothetical protein